MIAGIGVGDTAEIKVLRDGKEMTFKVEIDRREDARISAKGSGKEEPADELGIRVSGITPEIAERFNMREPDGVIVSGVLAGSKGEEAGIMAGDIIKEINHIAISRAKDFEAALRKVKKGEAISMFIRRTNVGFLVIKLTK